MHCLGYTLRKAVQFKQKVSGEDQLDAAQLENTAQSSCPKKHAKQKQETACLTFCFSDVFQLSRGTNEPTTPDTNARSGFSEALDCSGVDLVFEGGTDRLRLLTMSSEI